MEGHLILTRQRGESIVVTCGDRKLEITVHALGTNRVKLDCHGDQEMRVMRKEIEKRGAA
jgi:sRNA-binding carbon storage regulator CsrA